jgi:outer membrane lipoprotein carrier protein
MPLPSSLRVGAWWLGLILLAAGPVSTEGQPAALSPTELAVAIQARYDTVRDFEATFVHAYQGGALRTTAVERGTVRFKKPGMMRWTYVGPETKEFVSDGTRIYAYIPEDRQVTVSGLPQGDGASTPALFLAGRGHLGRDFVASTPTEPVPLPGTVSVTLTPRQHDADFEWMMLVVDRDTWRVRGLVTADAQGGRSSFTFENVRENVGLADKIFKFTIPRGVDVITQVQPGR